MTAKSGKPSRFVTILGVRFYDGEPQGIVDLVSESGGLLVAPAAPALKSIPYDRGYREALHGADYVIADSAFMVLLWNLVSRPRISKLSGLKYLRLLIEQAHFRGVGDSFWVMPSRKSAVWNLRWLGENGVRVTDEHTYVAPWYGTTISDAALIEMIQARKPRHVVLCIGGGNQERLGLYLKRNLDYRPAIHCIGAAIAFLSGDQVSIPVWVDALSLGWLWRCISSPRQNIQRYWEARQLAPLMFRYRERSPQIVDERTISDVSASS